MRRALRLTMSPTMAYSWRVGQPTEPQKTWPVVTPMEQSMPRSRSDSWISSAVLTPRTGSSSCEKGGRPKAAIRTVPLSSARNWRTMPSYLKTAVCMQQRMSLIAARYTSLLSSGMCVFSFTKSTVATRSSSPQPASCWESTVAWTASGVKQRSAASDSRRGQPLIFFTGSTGTPSVMHSTKKSFSRGSPLQRWRMSSHDSLLTTTSPDLLLSTAVRNCASGSPETRYSHEPLTEPA
mmetsp:Transcript_9542/g.38985  ORF Transcript_9542/g.38985 Transcript_9542/m.38985 type:complete len:237 (-) Transcript_9542:129-839(-)